MTAAALVLHGGVVFDGTDVVPGATAVGVRDGRVVAVGSDADVRRSVGAGADALDLRGRLVLPGFTDAHVHPVMAGVERLSCDLTGATDARETLARVRAYADANPGTDWLQGGGWLKEHFERGLPTAAELDSAVPDRPVVLRDSSHHAMWVNTAALQRVGLPADHPATLHEDEMDVVSAGLPPTSAAEQLAGLREAQTYLHSLGVTGWQDAILGDYAGHRDATGAYLALAAVGALTARVVGA
ncbi:MAG TPA: amidohydrolase family protein, partial [Actinomycetales bacterium]